MNNYISIVGSHYGEVQDVRHVLIEALKEVTLGELVAETAARNTYPDFSIDVDVHTDDVELKVLIGVRWLLNSPENWTQGFWAKDHEGLAVASESSTACQWCLVGAIHRVCYTLKLSTSEEDYAARVQTAIQVVAQEYINKYFGYMLASAWNDDPRRTLADVHDLLDTLIRKRITE